MTDQTRMPISAADVRNSSFPFTERHHTSIASSLEAPSPLMVITERALPPSSLCVCTPRRPSGALTGLEVLVPSSRDDGVGWLTDHRGNGDFTRLEIHRALQRASGHGRISERVWVEQSLGFTRFHVLVLGYRCFRVIHIEGKGRWCLLCFLSSYPHWINTSEIISIVFVLSPFKKSVSKV